MLSQGHNQTCFGDDVYKTYNTSREPHQEAGTIVQVRSNEDLDQYEGRRNRKEMMDSKGTKQIELARLGTVQTLEEKERRLKL